MSPIQTSRCSREATARTLLQGVSVALLIAACSEGGSESRGRGTYEQVDGYGVEIGAVEFPVSCSHDAQRHVARGLALLHHMMYPAAEKTFAAASAADPACAMAYWGLAAYYESETRILLAATRAWILYAAGEREAALEALRAVAEREAEQGGGGPSELLPATELLGEMLLELEEPEAALTAYRAVLEQRPNRLNRLIGAGRAADQAGDATTAAAYYREALATAGSAGEASVRLAGAKAFLNQRDP